MPISYRKKILKQIVNAGKRLKTPFSFNQETAYRYQMRTLKKLLQKAEDTDFGKQFQFNEILKSKFLYRSYRQQVPLMDYAALHSWWQRSYNGEENGTCPGKI